MYEELIWGTATATAPTLIGLFCIYALFDVLRGILFGRG